MLKREYSVLLVSCLAEGASSWGVMEVPSHSLFLLQQLNVQREFGFLCDCTVAIGNVYFKAHRAVLAAFSNYFKMIFIHQSRLGRGCRTTNIPEATGFFCL